MLYIRPVEGKYQLPYRLNSFIRRLVISYDGQGETKLSLILRNSRWRVQEEQEWDYYNNDQCPGHAVFLYVNEEILVGIGGLDQQEKVRERIENDLRVSAKSLHGEFICGVYVELFDPESAECKSLRSSYSQELPSSEPMNIWQPGFIRLFISHRDQYKQQASMLADALSMYGVSCFVAHDSIEPMSEWQTEIEKALATMDAMLVFLTDDFSDSNWTDHEVGVAVGRGVPIVPLKLQRKDPHGLISRYQAIKSSLDQAASSSTMIFNKLVQKLPKGEMLRDALIERFVSSENFDKSIFAVRTLLPLLDKFTEHEILKITDGFKKNDQLHNCAVVRRDLPGLMRQKTGEAYFIDGVNLYKPSDVNRNNEIPF